MHISSEKTVRHNKSIDTKAKLNCEIIRINEKTWLIEDGGVRLFLLEGSKKALLIDSGMNLNNARDIAGELTALPISLLNTHADRDHIGSNEQFESFYMHPAEEALYRHSGKGGSILPVNEGDILDLGERKLRIIHLPGHTPGSIAVMDTQNRVLISGDPIQAHGHIFMFGTHRSMSDYISSLERLKEFENEFDEIWPSHGDIPVSKELIDELRAGAENVLGGRVKGTKVSLFGKDAMAYDLGFTVLLADPMQKDVS